MNTYTWDDWDNLKSFLDVDFNPRNTSGIKNANDMIKYFLRCGHEGHGEEVLQQILDIFFKVPLEEVPLYVNTEIQVYTGRILISKIAMWRLRLGK